MASRSTYDPLPSRTNRIGRAVYDAAFTVHRELGPGLLEHVYRKALAVVLRAKGYEVAEEVPVPARFTGEELDIGFRADLIVEGCVIVEVKAVEELHPVHEAQMLTYLSQTDCRLGYLINFHVPLIKDGIHRRSL